MPRRSKTQMGRNFQMRVRFREEFGRPTIRRLIRTLPTPFKSGSDDQKKDSNICVGNWDSAVERNLSWIATFHYKISKINPSKIKEYVNSQIQCIQERLRCDRWEIWNLTRTRSEGACIRGSATDNNRTVWQIFETGKMNLKYTLSEKQDYSIFIGPRYTWGPFYGSESL